MAQNETNRSLERTAVILDALENECLSLSEISRITGISTSSVHRLMSSLVDFGFVRRDVKGKYLLGRRFNNSRSETIIRESLSRIRDETGVSSQFWIKRQDARLCIAAAYSEIDLEPKVAEGLRIPLAKGGSAGNILSSAPEALASLRSNGWVESKDVRTPGTSSISVPLIVNGRMYGAICAVMPSTMLQRSPGEDYGPSLSQHVKKLRSKLATLN